MTYKKKNDLLAQMPKELRTTVEAMTPFQRAYAEYRARGFNMGDAAERAGSEAQGRANLTKTGYNSEQVKGVKEYILFLQSQAAQRYAVDESEIIDKLREAYNYALEGGKYGDAIKAAELLGTYVGMFGKNAAAKKEEIDNEKKRTGEIQTNVEAFKDEGEDTSDRFKKLKHLMKDLKE